jgi:outer membrane lipoprotein-sorting protein
MSVSTGKKSGKIEEEMGKNGGKTRKWEKIEKKTKYQISIEITGIKFQISISISNFKFQSENMVKKSKNRNI